MGNLAQLGALVCHSLDVLESMARHHGLKKGLIVQGYRMQGPELLKLKVGSCGSAGGSSLVVINCLLQPKGQTRHHWLFGTDGKCGVCAIPLWYGVGRRGWSVDERSTKVSSKAFQSPDSKTSFRGEENGRKSERHGGTLDRAEDDVAEFTCGSHPMT